MRNKSVSKEHKEKLSKALKGKKHSLETLKKMSKARRAYWAKKRAESNSKTPFQTHPD
jgi:hypothetical protein